MNPTRTCAVDACDNPAHSRGWCHKHYHRWRTHGDVLYERPTPRERLMKFVDEHPSGCWEWTSHINKWGYGEFYYAGGIKFAHRVSYELHHGPIPSGFQVDHLCRNRSCVNPAHLEAVTQAENILRGTSPTAENARKTHCIRGHELSGYNLYIRKDRPGRRQCRECSRIAKRTGRPVGRPRKVD